jgi:hypothetical protein
MASMRRMFSVAFLSILLIAVPTAFAQHGGHSAGGHSGSVGHGFGGFSGSGFAGRSSGFAARSYATAPRFTSAAPVRNIATANRLPYGGITAARRPAGRSGFRYRSPYRGYGGYPYYASSWELLPWGLGYPDFTGDSDSAADAPQQQPAASVASPDDGYRPDYEQPAYQEPAYQMPPTSVADLAPVEPELTLIFNDGHREAIHNYVLTPDALIVMDQAASGRQQQIPLGSLNLPATEQAAQQAGLDFSPPA